MTLTSVIRIQALGQFQVEQAGRQLRIPRTKEKALIAFLAINAGRTFRREFLAHFLWPDVPDDKSRHSLNQAICTIRRIIPDLLTANNTTLSLAKGAVTTDLDLLRDSIAAGRVIEHLELIRGELLADLAILGNADFEDWRSNYNRDLLYRLRDAIRLEIEALPSARRHSLALKLSSIPEVLLPPIDVMNASGEPSGGGVDVVEHTGSHERFELPFVGRECQMGCMISAWEAAKSGSPQFITIEGHAGHGKSRLLQEFLASVNTDRPTVLSARCYESGRGVALGPLAEVIASSAVSHDLSELQPIWLAALQEIIPELPVRSTSLPQLSTVASQSRLYEAMLRAFMLLATQAPLVICLDDAQWLDKSSQEFLGFLHRRLTTSRVMVALATRPESQLTVLSKERGWTSAKVGELSGEDIGAALQSLTPSAASLALTASQLEHRTNGHPFLVTEVVKAALTRAYEQDTSIEATIDSVDSFVARMLEDLPQPAQEVAAALAVIARPASIGLVSSIARVQQVGKAIDVLIRKDIAYQSDGRVVLRHDIVGEVVYRRIPSFTRREMHRRAATFLSRRHSRRGEAAEHFLKAGEQRRAYRFALVAARHAESRHSNEETIYFLRLASAASPSRRPTLLSRLAEVLYRAHKIQEARAAYVELLSSPTQSPELRVVYAIRALELGYDLGMISERNLSQQLAEIRSRCINDSTVAPEVLYLQARTAFHHGDRDSAAAATYELKAFADRVQTHGRMDALAFAAHFHSAWISAIEADEWAGPLRACLTDVLDHEQKLRILVALTGVAYANGRLTEAMEYAEAATREIERVGAMNLWPLNAAYTHMLYVEQGRFTDAIRLRQTIQERLPNTYLDIASTVSANAASMHYERGDYDEALAEAAFGLSSAVNRQSTWTDLVLRGIQGLAALERGDFVTAATNADAGRDRINSLGTRMADLSYVEILISRIDNLRGRSAEALARLASAVEDYKSRDKVCQLRMMLERARILKKQDRGLARIIANEVYENARQINAVLIAEKADALLLRL